MKKFEPEIEQISLQPSQGGRFEVEVNGKLIFSKQESGRHANSGEVTGLIQNFLSEV